MILLKYHYCSHFMSLLKKNYEHLLDASNTCRDCKKNFQNSRRLLLHIGVNHDKINHILKVNIFKTLNIFTQKYQIFLRKNTKYFCAKKRNI